MWSCAHPLKSATKLTFSYWCLRIQNIVVDRTILPSPKYPCLNPQTYNYATLLGKEDFADKIGISCREIILDNSDWPNVF